MRLSIILALTLAGCSAPPDVETDEPAPVVQMPVKVRPNPDYRTSFAWYYVEQTDAYISLERAPIVEGRVQGITHVRVYLDWMLDPMDLVVEWDKELSHRERLP